MNCWVIPKVVHPKVKVSQYFIYHVLYRFVSIRQGSVTPSTRDSNLFSGDKSLGKSYSETVGTNYGTINGKNKCIHFDQGHYEKFHFFFKSLTLIRMWCVATF